MTAEPYHDVFPVAKQTMGTHSQVDFGFHFCVVTRDQLDQIPSYARDLGVSSYKFFMNFRGEEGAYLGLPGNDDGFMFDLLEACADNGTMLDPHAENIELVWRLREKGIPEGRTALEEWNLIRPDYVEADALNRLAFLSRVTGASVYAVHTTSALALDVLQQGRMDYENIFVESCPHYLTLDVDSACGVYGKVNPPLRYASDRDTLWSALEEGSIDTIGSDHVPRHKSFKEKDIWTASAGFPGMEKPAALPDFRGVPQAWVVASPHRASDERAPRAAVRTVPPEGAPLLPGSDADFVLVDLDATHMVVGGEQQSGAEYSPWEDWEMKGSVRSTFLRGTRIFDVVDGFSDPGGQFLSRRYSGARALEEV